MEAVRVHKEWTLAVMNEKGVEVPQAGKVAGSVFPRRQGRRFAVVLCLGPG